MIGSDAVHETTLADQLLHLTEQMKSADTIYEQSIQELTVKNKQQAVLIEQLNKKYIKYKTENIRLNDTVEQLKQLCRTMKIEYKQLQSQLQQYDTTTTIQRPKSLPNTQTIEHSINHSKHMSDGNVDAQYEENVAHMRTSSDKENITPDTTIQQPNQSPSPTLPHTNKKRITATLPTQKQLQPHTHVHNIPNAEITLPPRSLVTAQSLVVHPVQESLQLPANLKPPTNQRHKRHVSQTASLLRQSTQSLTLNSSICVNTLKHKPVQQYKERIFEQFMIVGCEPTVQPPQQNNNNRRQHTSNWTQTPTVMYSYGRNTDTSIEQLNDIAKFVCPNDISCDIVDMKRSTSDIMHILYGQQHLSPSSSWYTICLKIASQPNTTAGLNTVNEQQLDNLYGICIRTNELSRVLDNATQQYIDVSHQRVYCLLTRYPYYSLFFNVMQQLLKSLHLARLEHMATLNVMTITNELHCIQLQSLPDITVVLDALYTTSLPTTNSIVLPLQTQYNMQQYTDIQCPLPDSKYRDTKLIAEQHNIIAWHTITADILVYLFELTLREFKIVVVHNEPTIYTACCMSLLTLITPLQWVGVLLPSLPLSLIELVDSPVPYIVGLRELPYNLSSSNLNTYQCIYMPATNQIYLHHTYKSILYQRQKLVQKVEKQLSKLRQCRLDQRVSAPQIYTATPNELHMIDEILLTLKEHIVDMIDYIHDTRTQHGILDSNKESMASVMEHTQMCDHYFQLHEHAIRERRH